VLNVRQRAAACTRGGRATHAFGLARTAAAFLLFVGTAVCAQQVCDPEPASRSMPAERFDDQGDGTVIDRTTRLMWMKCVLGQTSSPGGCTGTAATSTWDGAQREAQALNRSGSLFYSDWRLPQVRELATITERACQNPRTNLSVFPATPAAPHWSATPRAGAASATVVYALNFGAEGVQLLDKSERAHVRLVRSAQ
jgi:hypothetical protein